MLVITRGYELRATVQRLQRDEVVEVMQKETCADCWRGGVEQAQLAHSTSQYIISPRSLICSNVDIYRLI
jgi:hypothetical protein